MKKVLTVILVLQSVILLAQEIPNYNQHQKFVSDFANILSEEQEKSLQNKLASYESKTGIEIAAVTQNDLQGYDIEGYANKLFETWGIGKKGANNGLLILVSPENRKWRVEVGYGLESNLTDGTCHNLSEQYLLPNFKKQFYYEGIDSIVTEFITILGNRTILEREQEKAAIELQRKKDKAKAEEAQNEAIATFFSWLLIVVLIAIIIISIVWFLLHLKNKREEKLEAERQRLLEIERKKEAEQRRIHKRNSNLSEYKNLLVTLEKKIQELGKVFNSCEKECLNNKELYSTGIIESYNSYEEVESQSDLDVERSVNNINYLIKKIDYSIAKIIENGIIRDNLLLQFKHLEQDYKNLQENIPRHLQDVKTFELKYHGLFNGVNKNFKINLEFIKSNLEKGIDLLNKDQILKTETYNQTKKIISEISNSLHDANGCFKEFSDLRIEVSNAELTISKITKAHLTNLFNKAKDIVNQQHVSSTTDHKFKDVKSIYENYRNSGSNHNILDLALFLKSLEKNLKLIPDMAQDDINDYHAEIKRQKEELEKKKQEEERRRRRKQQEEDDDEEERKRNSYSSSSYKSYNSSSDDNSSSSTFGGGSSGGGGDTGGW